MIIRVEFKNHNDDEIGDLIKELKKLCSKLAIDFPDVTIWDDE